MKHFVTQYPFSMLLICAIWIVCLIPIPETPLDDVPMIDKWTHFAMYGTLCLTLFCEYSYRHKTIDKQRLATFGVLIPCIMGGLIELAQAYLTGGNRSGDIMDWIANCIGVAIGTAIGSLLIFLHAKVRKDI